MKKNVEYQLNNLVARYPALEACRNDITNAFELIKACYSNGGKLIIAGNGGSAADSEHMVGELMKGFCNSRSLSDDVKAKLYAVDNELGSDLAAGLQGSLPAISLDGNNALATAFANDCNPVLCYAQQVYGLGKSNDVLFCISTSGNSKNVVYAAVVAKAKGLGIVSLTGQNDSKLKQLSDVCLCAPDTVTYKVQEYHLPIYHSLCLMLEEEFFGV